MEGSWPAASVESEVQFALFALARVRDIDLAALLPLTISPVIVVLPCAVTVNSYELPLVEVHPGAHRLPVCDVRIPVASRDVAELVEEPLDSVLNLRVCRPVPHASLFHMRDF